MKIIKQLSIGFLFGMIILSFFSFKPNAHKLELAHFEKVNTVTFTIDKATSDEHLTAIIDQLKSLDITASFNAVIRNAENHITSIKIALKNGISNANFSTNNSMGIDTLQIKLENGHISIGYLNGQGNMASMFGNLFSGFDDASMKNIMQAQQQMFSNLRQNNGVQLQQMMAMQKQMLQQFAEEDNQYMQSLMQQVKQVAEDESFQKNMSEMQNFFSGNNGIFSIQKLMNPNAINLDDFEEENYKMFYIVNGNKMSKDEFLKMNKKDIHTLEIKKNKK